MSAVWKMGCSECGVELSHDDLKCKIVCDRCGAKLCQACSGLGSTEIRCMPLRERKLKFFCGARACMDVGDQHAALVERILNSLKPLFDATFTRLKETTESSISSLSQQVADLTESNKDLIKLLNPTPATGKTVQSDSLPHPKIGKSVTAPLPRGKTPKVQKKGDKSIGPAKDDRDSCHQGVSAAEGSESGWQLFTGRRKRASRGVVVGTGGDGTSVGVVRGVARTVDLHVYRIAPGTKAESLRDLLKPRFPEVVCEELSSKHPEKYSSFKVGISEDNFGAAMEPSIWPVNTCVRRFFHPWKKSAAAV